MKTASKTITTLLSLFTLLACFLPQMAAPSVGGVSTTPCAHSCCSHLAKMSCCAMSAAPEVAPLQNAKGLAGASCNCQVEKGRKSVSAPAMAAPGAAKVIAILPAGNQIERSVQPIEASMPVATDSGPPRAPPPDRDAARAPPTA